MSSEQQPIHMVTPLRHSAALTKLVPDCAGVYLKMENCQIPGSFKIRGFGRQVQKLKDEGFTHVVIPTCGNAGLAVAHAAKQVGVKCTIFVPEFTLPEMLNQLRLSGANIKVKGACFEDSLALAEEESKNPGTAFVPPTGPEIWAGHSTIVDELVTQLPGKPSVIAASVSDGGLLTGILQGLKRAGWEDVPVLAMETKGADCFNLAIKANKVIETEVTSIAYSLGTKTVSPHVLEMMPDFKVISEVVTDAQAVESCIRFVDDEFTLVEPACGATLAAVYSGVLTKLQAEGLLPHLNSGPAVLIVCGGRIASLKLLQDWSKQFNVPYPYAATMTA